MDFFSVPTITFGVLYCFFIIGHDRRRILHFNVTRHPTSAWIAQQLREAFPYKPVAEFMILDHDSKYGAEVFASIHAMNIVQAYIGVGNNEQAIAWLGKAFTQHSNGLTALKVDPAYDPLRGQPGFQELLGRVGLSE
jgi:hypothetical protein